MTNRGLDLTTPYQYDQYDDEYDDTYDSQNVGIVDQDSTEFFPVKRYGNESIWYGNESIWYENKSTWYEKESVWYGNESVICMVWE